MIYFLFLLLIFSFPFGVLLRFQVYRDIAISITDLLAILIFFFSIINLRYFKRSFLKDRTIKHLILFTLTGLLGYFFTKNLTLPQIAISVLYLLRFFIYSLLFIEVRLLPNKKLKSIPLALLASGVLFSFFGLIQYVYYPNLRNLIYLGWDDHLYRLFSTFFDPNFTGLFILLTLLLALYLFLKNRNKYLLLFPLILLPSFFLTYSRSSYLSFILSFVVFIVIIKKYKFLLLLMVVFLFGLLFIPKNLRSEGVNLLRFASVSARAGEYNVALKTFTNYPVAGVGFNTYRYSKEGSEVKTIVNSYDHSGAGVPNSFLLVLATTGLIGAATFIWYLASLSKSILNKNNVLLSGLAVSSIIAVITQSLFENSFFYTYILAWLMIICGLAARAGKD